MRPPCFIYVFISTMVYISWQDYRYKEQTVSCIGVNYFWFSLLVGMVWITPEYDFWTVVYKECFAAAGGRPAWLCAAVLALRMPLTFEDVHGMYCSFIRR